MPFLDWKTGEVIAREVYSKHETWTPMDVTALPALDYGGHWDGAGRGYVGSDGCFLNTDIPETGPIRDHGDGIRSAPGGNPWEGHYDEQGNWWAD